MDPRLGPRKPLDVADELMHKHASSVHVVSNDVKRIFNSKPLSRHEPGQGFARHAGRANWTAFFARDLVVKHGSFDIIHSPLQDLNIVLLAV